MSKQVVSSKSNQMVVKKRIKMIQVITKKQVEMMFKIQTQMSR